MRHTNDIGETCHINSILCWLKRALLKVLQKNELVSRAARKDIDKKSTKIMNCRTFQKMEQMSLT